MPLERAVPSRPEAMPIPEAMPAESVAEPATAPANPVVVSLLQQADQFAQAGKLDRAAASVERGLRIAPKDAALWQRLASIKLQQGDYRQAESMARKSIALARGHRGMIADNWKIIAQAREQRGDQQGAILAREKSLQFRTPGF
jgi:tetratricopeptide (TPR) repeat protein